jgi:hypothetical protein
MIEAFDSLPGLVLDLDIRSEDRALARLICRNAGSGRCGRRVSQQHARTNGVTNPQGLSVSK